MILKMLQMMKFICFFWGRDFKTKHQRLPHPTTELWSSTLIWNRWNKERQTISSTWKIHQSSCFLLIQTVWTWTWNVNMKEPENVSGDFFTNDHAKTLITQRVNPNWILVWTSKVVSSLELSIALISIPNWNRPNGRPNWILVWTFKLDFSLDSQTGF